MTTADDTPPLISIVGRKNSGKTTLLVHVAAELRRRGVRVASVKHGHHDFEIDQPGRDSWRHVHEGRVEAVLMMARGRMAMVMTTPPAPPDVREAVRRHFGGSGYDVVLVEGLKYGDLPKIEIHRDGNAEGPVFDPDDRAAASLFLALVTDLPRPPAGVPVIELGPTAADAPHVFAVADLVERQALGREPTDG